MIVQRLLAADGSDDDRARALGGQIREEVLTRLRLGEYCRYEHGRWTFRYLGRVEGAGDVVERGFSRDFYQDARHTSVRRAIFVIADDGLVCGWYAQFRADQNGNIHPELILRAVSDQIDTLNRWSVGTLVMMLSQLRMVPAA